MAAQSSVTGERERGSDSTREDFAPTSAPVFGTQKVRSSNRPGAQGSTFRGDSEVSDSCSIRLPRKGPLIKDMCVHEVQWWLYHNSYFHFLGVISLPFLYRCWKLQQISCGVATKYSQANMAFLHKWEA